MSRLWPFALAFYAEDGVSPACLQCQNEIGADINLIIFLLWQSRAGVAFASDEIADLDRAIQPWREHVVEKLRGVVRYLRDGGQEALRSRLKTGVLEAERLQLETLAQHARPPAGPAPCESIARTNLAAYAAVLGRELPPDAVAVMLQALTHPDLPV